MKTEIFQIRYSRVSLKTVTGGTAIAQGSDGVKITANDCVTHEKETNNPKEESISQLQQL